MFHKIIDLLNILSRREQINPWGQFHFQNHKYSVHLPIFWKFFPFNDILTVHCICDLSRACHTIGQGHHRVIMLHAKFCGNGPPVPEKIFEGFLNYLGCHVTWISYVQIGSSLSIDASYQIWL